MKRFFGSRKSEFGGHTRSYASKPTTSASIFGGRQGYQNPFAVIGFVGCLV